MVRRKSFVLLLIALLFAAPGIAAYFFYKHPQWLGSAKTNKGMLLNPPLLVSNVGTKWQLLYWSSEPSDESCLTQMDRLARIRLALGRRLYEVETWLLLDTEVRDLPEQFVKTLHAHDVHVRMLTPSERGQLQTLGETSRIFIANPSHYLVLAYPPTALSDNIYHDLKQLLSR